MRWFVRALATVVLALALPALSAASGFEIFEIKVEEPMRLVFGPAGATFSGGSFDAIFFSGVEQETPWNTFFSGEVGFTTGPALSLSVDPARARSRYVFGPGTFTLIAHWSDQFGNPAEGRYIAPLLELVVDISCEQELTAFDCGDASGEDASLGDFFASFGPGTFDPALAHVLGLAPSGDPFDFHVALDGVSGSPSDGFRNSGSESGSEKLEFGVAIPEPSIISLLLLAPVFGLRFRR